MELQEFLSSTDNTKKNLLNLVDKKYKKSKGKGIDVKDRSFFEIAEKIKKNIGINVEVKTSTPEGTDKEAISEKKENEKIVPEKKITEKKEVKKSDNLK